MSTAGSAAAVGSSGPRRAAKVRKTALRRATDGSSAGAPPGTPAGTRDGTGAAADVAAGAAAGRTGPGRAARGTRRGRPPPSGDGTAALAATGRSAGRGAGATGAGPTRRVSGRRTTGITPVAVARTGSAGCGADASGATASTEPANTAAGRATATTVPRTAPAWTSTCAPRRRAIRPTTKKPSSEAPTAAVAEGSARRAATSSRCCGLIPMPSSVTVRSTPDGSAAVATRTRVTGSEERVAFSEQLRQQVGSGQRQVPEDRGVGAQRQVDPVGSPRSRWRRCGRRRTAASGRAGGARRRCPPAPAATRRCAASGWRGGRG